MEGQLRKYKKDKNWGVLAGSAMKMKIMNPEFSLDEDSERALADTLDDYKKYKDDDVNWHVFASLAAEMKIIDPDIDLQLDDVFWRNIKEQLEKERKKGQEEGYWDMFARHAGTAKILAAGKVKFTENGLEFMPPEKKEDLESTIPAMPETKQF